MKITLELDTDTLSPAQLTAVGMLMPNPFDREPRKKTIKRSDVRLKPGDVCKSREGERLSIIHRFGIEGFPVRGSNDFTYKPNGIHTDKGSHRPGDIVSVNGIQIEE